MELPVFDVTGAVAVLNQTFEYAFPTITIVGELSEMRVSKGKWLYFDIKDDESRLKCFGTVFQLRTPIEDGMKIELNACPRLHPQYGFSLTVQSLRPVGEGSIKKAKDLLQAKLEAEGLFSEERKRQLPYPPQRIALIASGESAAYADFIKVLKARWRHMSVDHYDVQVQGVQAEEDILRALSVVNQRVDVEVIVLIRGGGSVEDLAVFSTESVTRAIAVSRVPTMVAIGHEVDIALAERAADVRASTPSNTAELLVPDMSTVMESIDRSQKFLYRVVMDTFTQQRQQISTARVLLDNESVGFFERCRAATAQSELRLESYHPRRVLKRGYGIVRLENGELVKPGFPVRIGEQIHVELEHALISTKVVNVEKK